jgi:hypothetical protein
MWDRDIMLIPKADIAGAGATATYIGGCAL